MQQGAVQGPDAAVQHDAPVDVAAIDAPSSGSNAGFTPPAAAVTAWTGTSGNYAGVTPDLSCLGMARTDSPTTTAVTLTVTVRDFQSNNVVAGAHVAAYSTFGAPFATATSDGTGTATLTIPSGKTRIGFDLTEANSHETLTVDQLLEPSTATQTITLRTLSDSTVATLPALVGLTYTPGTTLELGAIHDCQGANLANAIATVSSTPATVHHLAGADTYYFSDSTDLPQHHNQKPATSRDGLFMVIGLPATTTAYVQVWGYENAADQASGTLTLDRGARGAAARVGGRGDRAGPAGDLVDLQLDVDAAVLLPAGLVRARRIERAARGDGELRLADAEVREVCRDGSGAARAEAEVVLLGAARVARPISETALPLSAPVVMQVAS